MPWGSSRDSLSGEDTIIVHAGPLASETVAQITHGEASMGMSWGVFRDAGVSTAFVKSQMPSVSHRRVFVVLCYAVYSAYIAVADWTISERPATGEPGAWIIGPTWYTLLLMLWGLFCATLLCFLPRLARRPGCAWVMRPRFGDALLGAMIGVFMLMLPRLWGDADPFGLSGQQPERGAHALRIASFSIVVGAGGVFFNPILALSVAAFSTYCFVVRFNALAAAAIGALRVAYEACLTAGDASVCEPLPPGVTTSDVHLLRLTDFWAVAFITFVLTVSHEVTVLEHFRLECALQLAAARRIDQLGCEKQRLDYERRLEVKQLADQLRLEEAHSRPPSLPASGSAKGELCNGEAGGVGVAEGIPGGMHHSKDILQGSPPPSVSSTELIRARASSSKASSSTRGHPPTLRRVLALERPPLCPSSPKPSSDGTCAELVDLAAVVAQAHDPSQLAHLHGELLRVLELLEIQAESTATGSGSASGVSSSLTNLQADGDSFTTRLYAHPVRAGAAPPAASGGARPRPTRADKARTAGGAMPFLDRGRGRNSAPPASPSLGAAAAPGEASAPVNRAAQRKPPGTATCCGTARAGNDVLRPTAKVPISDLDA